MQKSVKEIRKFWGKSEKDMSDEELRKFDEKARLFVNLVIERVESMTPEEKEKADKWVKEQKKVKKNKTLLKE